MTAFFEIDLFRGSLVLLCQYFHGIIVPSSCWRSIAMGLKDEFGRYVEMLSEELGHCCRGGAGMGWRACPGTSRSRPGSLMTRVIRSRVNTRWVWRGSTAGS